MAQLFEIKKVTVGPKNLDAIVELAANAPVMTIDDLRGTTLVWEVMPELRNHVCLGDESGTFGDVMGNTELAHLLEHVTVELLARTDVADVSCGQTAEIGERMYKLTFKCVDDVLVVGALSSAAWLMQWAFSGGGEPKPDADAIAKGLVGLVESLPPSEKPQAATGEPAAEVEPVASSVEQNTASDQGSVDDDMSLEDAPATVDAPVDTAVSEVSAEASDPAEPQPAGE